MWNDDQFKAAVYIVFVTFCCEMFSMLMSHGVLYVDVAWLNCISSLTILIYWAVIKLKTWPDMVFIKSKSKSIAGILKPSSVFCSHPVLWDYCNDGVCQWMLTHYVPCGRQGRLIDLVRWPRVSVNVNPWSAVWLSGSTDWSCQEESDQSLACYISGVWWSWPHVWYGLWYVCWASYCSNNAF